MSKFDRAKRVARGSGVWCLVLAQAFVPNSLFGQPSEGAGLKQSPAASAKEAASTATGFISAAVGLLFGRVGNGPEVEFKVGDLFGPGTTFRTGDNSEATLLFADGQNITLGPSSQLRVADYRFDARDIKSSRATLALSAGIMRLVTGVIHSDNANGLSVSAGNASIGILSKDTTAFVVQVDPKSAGIGAVAVSIGEVSVQTPAGRIPRLASDQFTRWQSGVPPASPMPLAAAPAIFQAIVAASRATIVGSNAPIDVLAASLEATLGNLPATAAGETQGPVLQAQASQSSSTIVAPATTSGGGRGCVGSPC